jgi:hypothetical protein
MERQPDLPDRTLVLKLGRLTMRQPEQDLLNAVANRRNAIWSELLDGLNAIVAYLRDHPEPVPVTFRMADFAALALKIATLWGRREELENALIKLEGAQAELVLESEPIHPVLALWLQNSANHGREMEAGTGLKPTERLRASRGRRSRGQRRTRTLAVRPNNRSSK